MGYNGDCREEVVECDDGVEDHEQSLRYTEIILQGSSDFRFKILDAIVRDVANSTTTQPWEFERGDANYPVVRELCLQSLQGIDFVAISGAGFQNFPRIWWKERSVSTEGSVYKRALG